MAAYERLVSEMSNTISLGLSRNADLKEIASDVVHEFLEAGSDDVELWARLFLAAREAAKVLTHG